MRDLKKRLEVEVLKRDEFSEISESKPDPLLIARKYNDEYIALICALFAYGNAKQIVKFLSGLDFSLLDESESVIKEATKEYYYRFQNSQDVGEFFITLKRLKSEKSIEELFLEGYKKERCILEGLNTVISYIISINNYNSRGYSFLIGSPPTIKSKSTYKRWNMFLRWMVREDNIDLGLWKNVFKSDLLIPLDTHTFNVSRSLGLLSRKTYDLKAVIELSESLRKLDKDDPIKYDFALYRMGQEKII